MDLICNFRSAEPIQWSESTAYGFGIGRLKSLEPLFFDRNAYNKLIWTKDVYEYLKQLAETRYSKFFDQESEKNPSLIFSRAELEALKLSIEYANEQWFRSLLILPVYILSLKTELKRQLAPSEPGDKFLVRKPAPPAHLPQDIEATITRVAVKALTRAQQTNDPSIIDILLDQAETELALDISIGHDFAHRYYMLAADLLNVRIFLRLRLLGERIEDWDMVLVRGGKIPLTSFRSLNSMAPEDWKTFFKGTPFSELIQAGVNALTGKGWFTIGERRFREILMEYANRARYVAMGYEPIFRFYLLGQNELTNIRLLYGAKVSGLEPAMCQDFIVYAI